MDSIMRQLGAEQMPQDGMPTDQPQGPQQTDQNFMGIEGAQDTRPEVAPSGEAPVAGLNAEFARRFDGLQKAVQDAGGDVTFFSASRDHEQQAQLFNDALAKYGSVAEAKKHVSPPGKSHHDPHAGLRHGVGDGAVGGDIRGDLAIAYQLAPHFGLEFPEKNQPWHLSMAGLKAK